MSDNLDDYNFRAIRKCLHTVFDDVELDSFCQDFYYESVYFKMSRGMQRDEKINLLMAQCRKSDESIENLLSLIDKVQPDVFKHFEEKIRRKKRDKNILIDTILEWKILHHNSQLFLREVEFFLEALGNYNLDPSLKLISEAGLTWQRNLKDKLTIFNYKFEHIHTTYIYDLHDKMNHFHLIVQKIMGDVDHEDFLYLHQWFLEFKKILWNMLEISDDHIKKTAQALQPN